MAHSSTGRPIVRVSNNDCEDFLQKGVVCELTYETGRDRIGPSSMFGRLMTSRPIRIEDGRDVRGGARPTAERSAKKRGYCALAGSSWALFLAAR
ncbi:hypothetical protein NDU88_001037 [Pleurodeles waltl]|uniref:Uncharacterized protein n=1 Tax=Pleurodeles waltl TaxID=8319 RepID=A0AAV7VVA3_PLEWA|nr:hypothetical protein NDU88_001037 [Pleurodeles waltl]